MTRFAIVHFLRFRDLPTHYTAAARATGKSEAEALLREHAERHGRSQVAAVRDDDALYLWAPVSVEPRVMGMARIPGRPGLAEAVFSQPAEWRDTA